MSAPPNCRLRWILLKHSKWWILLSTTWKIIANSTNRLAQPSTKAPTKQLVNLSYFNHEGTLWTTSAKQQKHPLTKTDHTAVMVAHLAPGCDGIFTPCSYQRWQRWRLRSHRVGQLCRKTWRKQRLQKWVASGYRKMGSKWVTCQSSFIESNPWIR